MYWSDTYDASGCIKSVAIHMDGFYRKDLWIARQVRNANNELVDDVFDGRAANRSDHVLLVHFIEDCRRALNPGAVEFTQTKDKQTLPTLGVENRHSDPSK